MKTQFEKAGYTKDTKFRVVNDNIYFNEGDIVTIHFDDKTDMPKFIKSIDTTGYMYLPGIDRDYRFMLEIAEPSTREEVFRLINAVLDGDMVGISTCAFRGVCGHSCSSPISQAAFHINKAIQHIDSGWGFTLKSESNKTRISEIDKQIAELDEKKAELVKQKEELQNGNA